MTMKQDVLNEFNMYPGISFKQLRANLDAKETSLSPCLTDLKKFGLIEQVSKLYYLTDAGVAELKNTDTASSKPEKSPEQKTPEQKTPEQPDSNLAEKPSEGNTTPDISEQLNRLKQQLNTHIPNNITVKIQVCQKIGELLSDDLKDIMIDISTDYQKLSSENG